ncbi:terminase large subunit [Rhodovulum sulfidophilum]|uniref:Terminase n=6 Tax=Rhodovulum TaxID=34008 RepID=A0ABS1RYL3_RHOSU|nr:terminase TerL endonuclease subunit [Rhodovulum sulfidophilum]MBL3611161.1 terminase [Rhodovulum sulfidophilum]MCE8420095.1 phage terminase family protein [Rhodovulum sulfidophilum]MCE8458389.1 phage terminase family protein [Rhodovulum sulfidophilum]
MDPIDHPVSRYALDVIEGREIAGTLVRLACERHLMDLETGRDRGLWFDCKLASRVLNFARLIKHTTGPAAGRPLELTPWQVFRHGSVFGWKQADGLRRFRTTYHQVAKKNGKTTDTAVPMLFTQLFDGEAAPQGFCTATTRDQAGLLFRELRRMIKAAPALSAFMDLGNKHVITTGCTNGTIRTLSRDGNSADGINPSFVARDEVHRWTDRELAEVVVNSMIARAQPIDWAITTAGADMASICGELREYSATVLRGDVEDDSFFAYVAEPPADCDVGDPVAWKMANPNLGIAFSEERFAELYREATVISGKMPNFRRLHMNLWTEGAQSWIEREIWDRGAEPFAPEALYGRPAWVGLDLSKTTDLTSICIAIPKDGQVYLISYSFLPSGPKGFIARAQSEKREYVAWRDQGWLEVHGGGVIDEDRVIERLEWIRARFDLRELSYDRWGMKYVAKELVKRRFPLVEHGQGYASMSSPMKRFERAVAQGRLRHGGNPVLAWAVGNVHRDEDAAENIKPNKARSKGRIDPAVAAIMALGRAEAEAGKRKARDVATV